MTRVVVIEDHPLYRNGVVSLLADLAGIVVVGAYGDAESALAGADEDAADLVILDLGLPGMTGIAALPLLRETASHPAILVLTMSEDAPVVYAALRAGARGYIVKGSEPEDIVRAVEGVARGQAVFGEPATAALQAPALATRGMLGELTRREHEVLDLVARGRSNGEIATALFLSEKTARNHVSNISTKLAATSRADLVAKARDAGFGGA